MAVPNTAQELLDLIRKSALLPSEKLAQFLGKHEPLPAEAKELAKHLIRDKLLTAFQLKLLLAGRYKGFRLGQYLLLDQIGQGGMGAVYRAEHEVSGQRAAIKVLPPGGSAITVERFLREARSAALLDHPNIVKLFEAGQEGNVHFLAMEFAEGKTLDYVVNDNGPLPAGYAVNYIAQAAVGLQHAFEKGLIHRDIKPGNLILTPEGTVKLLDMGLARTTDHLDQLTDRLDSGAVVGTADYISPEQAVNDPNTDIRSDIYSLGATFFAIVTGRPPFEGITASKLIQHQIKPAPSITDLDKTFPAEISKIIAKMMAKKPADRYQTPAELIAALQPWINDDEALQAGLARTIAGSTGSLAKHRAKSKTKRATTASQKKRVSVLLLATIGLFLLGLVGAAGAIFYFTNQKPNVVQTPPPTQSNTTIATEPSIPTPPTTPTTKPTKVIPPTPETAKAFFQFTAAKLPESRIVRERRNRIEGDTSDKFPKGIYSQSYKPDSKGEFVSTMIDGKRVIGLRNLTEHKSAQIAFDLETDVGLKFNTESLYTITIEYRTTNNALSQIYIQNRTPDMKFIKIIDLKLPKSDENWETRSVQFRKPEGANVRMVVDNLSESADAWLYFSKITITEER